MFGGGMFGGGMGGGLMGLVNNPQVREHLKLNATQVGQLTILQEELREQARERFSGFGNFREMSQEQREARMREIQEQAQKQAQETEKKLAEILTKEQFKRAKQIELQQQGVRALQRDDIIQALGVTEEQQQKLQAVAEEVGNKRRELFSGGFRDMTEEQRAGLREKMQALQGELEKNSMAVLSGDQKTKLKQIMGEPFELERPEMRGFEGRGFGGRGGEGGPEGGRREGGRNRPRRPDA
jgi:hypothetical protein